MKALGTVIEPELHKDLVTLNMVRDLKIEGDAVNFTVMLTTPACPLKHVMERDARAALKKIGVENVSIKWSSNVPTDNRIIGQISLPVKNTLAIGSGKGGVGKSTVSVNVAVALAQSWASVGLLDADIYGPNANIMLGALRMPAPKGQMMVPAQAHGVKLMSMGFLVKADQPLIWRGPMLHSAIRQFLTEVEWGDLDYLIVDLPPGTGDAPLSVSQAVPLSGSVIVTLPPALCGRLDYDPILPGLRDQLTQRVPMGSVIKCSAVYDRPFWRDAGLTGQATSDSGAVRITFDNSPPDGRPGVLLGFIEGDEARAWGQRSPSDRRAAVLESLVAYFGAPAGAPTAYIEHDWSADPWTRGCYGGFMPPGVLTTYGPALREAIGRVHWAGTETADVSNGYMDGAVRSGERAAGEIAGT